MDPSQEPAPTASRGSSTVRGFAFVLLAVAGLLLMFGLGYGVSDLTSDDEPQVVAPAGGAAEPAAAETDTSGDASAPEEAQERSELAVGVSILEEIFEILQEEFVDKEILDERSLRDAAIPRRHRLAQRPVHGIPQS